MKPHQHKPPQSAVRLRDLSKKDRKRVILNATVRVVIGTALMFMAYWLTPFENQYGVHPFVVMLMLLALFGFFIYFSVRRVLYDNFPQLKAIQVAIFSVTFYLYAFAALYLGMSVTDPNHFTEPLSHVGAFYFTVVVASTVGFGDITPNDDVTRIIVTGQMLVNIALIGVGVRAILALGKMRTTNAPHLTQPTPEDAAESTGPAAVPANEPRPAPESE
jgi:hypothetical protein